MEIRTDVETITPAIARQYLKANVNNPRGQKVRMARVKQYAHDMERGLWELNGEAIVFDRNGVLKNGAHRLAAVIMANVPVKMTVTRGVDENVTAFDITYVRTVSQLANADDIDVKPNMLRAVKFLYTLLPDTVATHMEIKEYAKRNADELNRAGRCLIEGVQSPKKVNLKSSCSLAAYMMLKTQTMPYYEVELFFRVFSTRDTTGTDGYETSPALIARKMFEERWEKAGNVRAQKEQLDILIRALTDFHEGKERKTNYKVAMPFSFEPLLKKLGGGV